MIFVIIFDTIIVYKKFGKKIIGATQHNQYTKDPFWPVMSDPPILSHVIKINT